MKCLKYYLVVVLSLFSVMAYSVGDKTTGLREKVWHDHFGPGFEIQNKGNTIWVAVAADNDFERFFQLSNSSRESIEISDKGPIVVGIYNKEPGVNPRGYTRGKFVASKQPDKIYNIKNRDGKTVYVTWNPEKYKTPEKSLYPQTGKWMGMAGKTESGYSLSENITQSDIVLSK